MTTSEGLLAELKSVKNELSGLSHDTFEKVSQLKSRIDAVEKKLLPQPKKITDILEKKSTITSLPKPKLFVEKTQITPQPTPVRDKGKFEMQLGRVWLVRIGIALLVTGLVLLGNYAYQNWVRDLPPFIRLIGLFLTAFGLSIGGHTLSKKPRMERFGEVLLSGGLAFGYWCTYASHHIERLRVIDSPLLATLCLLAAAGGIVGISLKFGRQNIAVMGILLASYSTMLQPLGWLSGLSNTLLAATGVGLLYRRGWQGSGLAAAVGIYGSFLWWQILGATPSSQVFFSAWFLIPSWALFALPGISITDKYFTESLTTRIRFWFTAANNTAFFALFSLCWYVEKGSDQLWIISAIFGSILVALGILDRGRHTSASVHFTQGLTLLSLALILKLDGYHLPLALSLEAVALMCIAQRLSGHIESYFAGIVALAAGVFAYTSDIPLWTAGSTALLITITGIGMRQFPKPKSSLLDSLTWVVSLTGAFVGIGLWCYHLDLFTSLVVSTSFSAAFSGIILKGSRRLNWTDLHISVLGFLLFGLYRIFEILSLSPLSPTVFVLPILLLMTTLYLWEVVEKSETYPIATFCIILCQIGIVGLIIFPTVQASLDTKAGLSLLTLSAAGLAIIGRFGLRIHGLFLPASILLLSSLTYQIQLLGSAFHLSVFLPLIGSVLLCTLLRWQREMIGLSDKLSFIISRITLSLSWILGVFILGKINNSGDIFALTAIGLVFVCRYAVRVPIPKELFLYLVLASLFFIARIMIDQSWGSPDQDLLLQVALIVSTVYYPAQTKRPKGIQTAFICLASLSCTAWFTLYVGFSSMVILWALLGFCHVALGLKLRLSVLRKIGFALLTIATLRLFTIDIWNYATFTRVSAFIALGTSLVGLGFFYNKIGQLLEQLNDDGSDTGT